jgi:LCP family protein required for cell wall assembly
MRRGIARHGRLRRHPLATAGKVVLSIASVVVLSAVGMVGVAALDLRSDAPPPVHLVHLAGQKVQEIPSIGAIPGGVNLLIAASDTRSGQGDAWGTTDDSAGVGNNDVTMLLHLSQDHTHAEVISFPRDLIIDFPKCPDGSGGWIGARDGAQLNTSLSEGGPNGGLACTVSVIEQLTGLTIPFAGWIKFEGVVAMSNAVGGVQVCIGGDGIHDPDTSLDLPPGDVTLQGQQAVEFLRTRHGVGDGSDLNRISNQQVFLSALVRTIMSNDTLTNPLKVWGLAKAATQYFQFSDTLTSPATLVQMALALKGLNWNDITFMQYPTLTDPDDTNRVIPDESSAQTLMDALRADQPVTLTGGTGYGGSIESTAPPAPQPSASPTPQAGHSGPGGASTTPAPTSTPVQLDSNVHGQTAATQTCSNGAG